MDRNDELLLALKWVRKPSGRSDAFEWFDPQGNHVESEDLHDTDPEVKRPRPYDSVDDAIACVPEGYWWLLMRPGRSNGKFMGEYGARLHSSISSGGGPKWEAFADTPAEALAQAILEAVK